MSLRVQDSYIVPETTAVGLSDDELYQNIILGVKS